jgi:hypothetical protein
MRAIATIVGLVGLTAQVGHGQNPHRIPEGRAIGATLDRFVVLEEGEAYRLTTFTLHVSSLKYNQAAPEFGLALFPRVLAAGALALAPDVGGAVNVSLPRVSLLPRVGASGLFVLSAQGSSVTLVGYHVGIGLLVHIGARDAIRIDFLHRRFFSSREDIGPTYSIGIGVSGVPPIR